MNFMAYNDELNGNEQQKLTAFNTQYKLREATDQSDKLNTIYDNNYRARTAALESAYNQKNMDYDRAEQKVAPTYDTQRNDLETQYQIARHNMGERAAANGINSGTGTQIALSQQNEYLRNYGNLNRQEAAARSDLEFERAKASAAYRDAVAQALADNDVERAKALYDEAVRVDNSMVATAQAQIQLDMQREATEWNRMKDQADNLAKFGDFSGYAALGYSADQIAQMRTIWAAENPLLAAALGIYTGGYGGGYASGGGYRRSGGGYRRSGGGGGTPVETAPVTRTTPVNNNTLGGRVGSTIGRGIGNGVNIIKNGGKSGGGSSKKTTSSVPLTYNSGWNSAIGKSARNKAMGK